MTIGLQDKGKFLLQWPLLAYWLLLSYISETDLLLVLIRSILPCADPEGRGAGVPDPLKNHKNIGFLSNTGPNPL